MDTEDLEQSPIKEVEAIPEEELQAPIEETDATPASEEESSEENSKPDYKGELTKLEKKIAQARYSLSQVEKKKEEAVPDIEEVVRKVVSEQRSLENQDKLEQELSSIQNEDERKLVEFHLSNTIKSTGNPVQDVRTAKILANSSKFAVENAELKRAVSTRGSSDSYASSSVKAGDVKTDNYSKYFSKEQLQRFKQMKINPKDIVEKAKKQQGAHYATTTLEDITP